MKIDATRYKLFMTNPEEYRIREIFGHTPTKRNDVSDLLTTGRRRGTAFHELTDGKDVSELGHLGEGAVKTAQMMHEANQEYSKDTEVIWQEKEFDVAIPDSPHRMVGRVDSLVKRGGRGPFIRDFKTTKYRTKEDMQRYKDELTQNPQVDFYLIGVDEPVSEFVYQILFKKPAVQLKGRVKPAEVVITEHPVLRQPYELRAMQRSVHMVCETIEFWTKQFGTEQPWPRAIKLPFSPDLYPYAPIYQRPMYEGLELEGFEQRVEHLDSMRTVMCVCNSPRETNGYCRTCDKVYGSEEADGSPKVL